MDPIAPWTLEELSDRASAALAHDCVGQQNGQVSEIPNGRTIRYYATIGLLDRPHAAGRIAKYGRRHLLQLIAVKRLQAEGLQLAQVQARLAALAEGELEALAALPSDNEIEALLTPRPAPLHGPAPRTDSRRERSFWSAEPDLPGAALAAATTSHATTAAALVAGIHLSEGVTLSFPAARTLGDDDIEALRAALGPVVSALRAQGLLADPEGETK